MVNYKRVVCEVALVAALALVVSAAPAHDCEEKHYDQSQNGTENYRLNIDGVVIAIAPAETLMAAASDIDLSELLALSEDFADSQKPKPPASSSKPEWDKPQDGMPLDMKPSEDPKPSPKPEELESLLFAKPTDKPEVKADLKKNSKRKHENAQRLKQRLANIILPFLKRSHHHDHHDHHHNDEHHDHH